jgi:hypothetical protein
MTKLPSYFHLPAKTAAVVKPERGLEEETPEWKKPENPDKQEQGETIPSLEMLQGMTLREFRTSGLVVVVHCPVLGDEVVFAADGTETSLHGFDDKGRVVYRGEELRLLTLLAPNPEDLVAYHRLGKAVGEVQVESIGLDSPEEVKEDPAKRKKKGQAA